MDKHDVNDPRMSLLAERLDAVVIRLLLPLRLSKTIDESALSELHGIIDELKPILTSQESVPRLLTGQLWFIFCSMLAEAEHAPDAKTQEAIELAAWTFQEKLRRIYGPYF